jgi:hypothetical protein
MMRIAALKGDEGVEIIRVGDESSSLSSGVFLRCGIGVEGQLCLGQVVLSLSEIAESQKMLGEGNVEVCLSFTA